MPSKLKCAESSKLPATVALRGGGGGSPSHTQAMEHMHGEAKAKALKERVQSLGEDLSPASSVGDESQNLL